MMYKASLFIRSVFFYIGYITTLVPHACLCVIFGAFIPLTSRYKYFVLWNRFVIWWLKICCKVHFEVHGKENIPNDSFVLLSNHQSPWETLFLYYYFQPLTATLKKQLLLLPFFGWGLALLKPIAIDRSKKRDARQMLLTQGAQRLNSGISVLVFPEGTRVNPGQTKRFSTGGAGLAISAKSIILPVAHDSGKYWPAHKFLKYPGTVKVVIGTPITTTGDEAARPLTEEIESWIRQAH